MNRLRRIALAATLTGSLCALAPIAGAQTWPAKPITLVSPYPAGGITDILSRIVAAELAKALGQPVVVENRTGAGGAIALASVAKAPADGHTLVMGGSAPSVLIPALSPNATYAPKDFEPVANVASLPIMLVVHPSIPAGNLKEFMAYARANADRLNCGHHGVGTGTHLACIQFARALGVRIADVPYKGAPQVNQDLLANRLQMYFGTLPTQIGYVRAGQMKTYGVASPERVSSAPDIPTLAEQGLPGMDLDTWNALYAPAGTPKAIVARINAEVVKMLQTPEVRQKIEATGSIPRPSTPEQLGRLTDEQYQAYRKLAAETNIRIE